MGSRWNLGRAGAALAAATVMVSMAALPASAEAARGRLTDAKTEGVSVNIVGKSDSLQASLLHLKLSDGTVLKMYCVEINVGASRDQDMVEVAWDSYPNDDSPFNDNRGKINWVLHHGFPSTSLKTLNDLDLAWGEDGLEEHEAISATQAAVWHFSDDVDLNLDNPSTRADANDDIRALYKYLVDNAKDDKEQPTPALEINPAEVDGEAGKLVGPFKVTTNGTITKLTADLPDGVEVTDGQGNVLTADKIKNGTEVFLKVPADAEAGEGGFKLSVESKLDTGRLFVGEDYVKNPAQSLIVAESENAKLDAEAKGSWTVTPTTPPTTTTPPATTVPPTTTTTVAPAPQPKNDLPDTGASILLPVLIGLGLVGAGAGALIYQRRRKSA
ncbi:thioester domain-containing protein [Actinokineospora sp.]|uniref:thioester domain-containing protein n=1 Tax=Actinokineospora sp. TaxID=1872133 RepID=UPI0040381242